MSKALVQLGDDIPDGSTVIVYFSKKWIPKVDETFFSGAIAIDKVILSTEKLKESEFDYFLHTGGSRSLFIRFKYSDDDKSYYELV